jgi:hypothetical protein
MKRYSFMTLRDKYVKIKAKEVGFVPHDITE